VRAELLEACRYLLQVAGIHRLLQLFLHPVVQRALTALARVVVIGAGRGLLIERSRKNRGGHHSNNCKTLHEFSPASGTPTRS
jgi:hypothetical protein